MIQTSARKDVASSRKTPKTGKAPAARKGGEKSAAVRANGNAGTAAVSGVAVNGHAHQADAAQTGESLEQCVFRSLEQYFANLNGAKPHPLHNLVLGAIERPLLQFALQRCEGNQSAAADLLGMNRNTLRRKLNEYGIH